jgi:hypothetical protein
VVYEVGFASHGGHRLLPAPHKIRAYISFREGDENRRSLSWNR